MSLSLLLSNQQSLPRALTQLMLDQTRARARGCCKRAVEHMIHELQQTEAVYAAHTVMYDSLPEDKSLNGTARSSTGGLATSERSAQFGASNASSY